MQKKIIVLSFFAFCCFAQLEAHYMPASLAEKHQFGSIDSGFFYESSGGGGGWMSKSAEYWGSALDVLRAVVPSVMVSWAGNLYTLTLHDFGVNGPQFKLAKFFYSASQKNVKETSTLYYPWKYVWNSDYSTSLNLSQYPNFKHADDEKYFKWAFHNIFHPCIMQEINSSSTFLRIFHYIPTCRLANEEQKNANGTAFIDNEGGLLLKWNKSDLGYNMKGIINKNDTNLLGWNFASRRNFENAKKPFCFPCNQGNFQGFHLESNPYFLWVFHVLI